MNKRSACWQLHVLSRGWSIAVACRFSQVCVRLGHYICYFFVFEESLEECLVIGERLLFVQVLVRYCQRFACLFVRAAR